MKYRIRNQICLAIIVLGLAGLTTGRAQEIDMAPLWQIKHTIKDSMRRALGPFLEWNETHEPKKTLLIAVRPLFSIYKDKSREYFALDILYPIWSYRRYGDRSISLGLLSRGMNEDVNDSKGAWQNYFMPLYCLGRSRDGKRYGALFPIGGVMREFFSYDYISFWLFPLYMRSVKNDHIVSTHFLFPIFLKTDGKNIKKRRIFPLIGYNRQKGKWVNYFFLWPFVTWGFSLDPNVDGWAYGLFPLFARMQYHDHKTGKWSRNTTILWPFFKFAKMHTGFDIHAPWPFFIHGRGHNGPGTRRTWIWPFWGTETKAGGEEKNTFWLWPLFFNYHRPTLKGHLDLRYIAIFWLKAVSHNAETGKEEVFSRFWPLLSSLKREDGSRRIRILDVFPLRHVEPIDRNLVPIMTLYQYQSDKERFRHDLLWGLWQFEKKKKSHVRRHSLFPLYQYKRSEDGKVSSMRFLTGIFKMSKDTYGKRHVKIFWFIPLTRKAKVPKAELKAVPAGN